MDLWLIHTAWEWHRGRYREWEWYNGKQWVLVPVAISDQYEHFYMVLYFLFGPRTGLGPIPMQCEYTINSDSIVLLSSFLRIEYKTKNTTPNIQPTFHQIVIRVNISKISLFAGYHSRLLVLYTEIANGPFRDTIFFTGILGSIASLQEIFLLLNAQDSHKFKFHFIDSNNFDIKKNSL